MREKNLEVAVFLCGCAPNNSGSVYSIIQQIHHPDHEELMAARGDWPFDYVPALDSDVLKALSTKESGNEEARHMWDGWRASKQAGDGVLACCMTDFFWGGFVIPGRCRSRC